MQKGIVGQIAVRIPLSQPKASQGVGTGEVVAGIERQAARQGRLPIGWDQARMPLQSGVQANVLRFAVVEFPKGVFAEINGGVGIDLQKMIEPTAVIVVTVGKDGNVGGCEINAKLIGVPREQIGLSHVEKNAMIFGFDP